MKGNGAYARIHHQTDRLLKKQNIVIMICIITYGLVILIFFSFFNFHLFIQQKKFICNDSLAYK